MSDERDQPARSAGTDAGAATDERAAASDDTHAEATGDVPGATASSPLATGVPATVGGGPAATPVSDARFLAPAALAGVSLAVAAVAPEVFALTSAGVGRLVGGPLLAALALASAWATLGMFDDAARQTEATWWSDPWRYLAGGTAALLGIRLVQVWTGGVEPTRPVPYLAGSAVVAVLLAPVLAGPVYVLVRWRVARTENDDSTGR